MPNTFEELYRHCYNGILVHPELGPFPCRLANVRFDPDNKWHMLGESGECGKIQEWAKTLPEDSFKVEILSTYRGGLNMNYNDPPPEEVTLPQGQAVQFQGVKFTRISCNSNSIFCSGRVEFTCESFNIISNDITCDEPVYVEIR